MAQQKLAPLKSMIVSACNRILSKGRKAIVDRTVKENSGSEAIETWNRTLTEYFPDRLPLPTSFTFKIKYQDTLTTNCDRIVLTSHGSPGSYEDFKYMIPKLSNDDGVRILGMNWPEHGYSEVMDEGERYFCHSSEERAELLAEFLDRLKIKKVDVLVGHSFGCYPLMTFAADEEYRRYCKALLLINCGGVTPHKSIRPYSVFQIIAELCYRPFIGKSISLMSYLIAKYVWGVRVQSPESAAINVNVIAHLGFQQLPRRVESLRNDRKTPRVLFVYNEDDPLIEKEASENMTRSLGCPNQPVLGWEKDALEKVEKWWKNGETKNLAVNFGKGRGGHFLQKHQADFLASCIRIMCEK